MSQSFEIQLDAETILITIEMIGKAQMFKATEFDQKNFGKVSREKY